MAGCPKGIGVPHDCRATWTCGHGRTFPRHKPDGAWRASNDGPGRCPECAAECRQANALLAKSGVVDELNAALRSMREEAQP